MAKRRIILFYSAFLSGVLVYRMAIRWLLVVVSNEEKIVKFVTTTDSWVFDVMLLAGLLAFPVATLLRSAMRRISFSLLLFLAGLLGMLAGIAFILSQH
ncbi:MAG: hypothetical protein C4576_31790 [Desulfobacteraceae bacterium]|nr:MAG: hypothetical protein C4576_31790 [Desulfobacteraceae bacterium]